METLVFVAGLQQGLRFAIDRDLVRLGRERFNDLTIDDESASRAQAEILRRDGGLAIRDLGSTNGTYVNNRRITETALADGDRISVGSTVMLVEIKDRPERPRTRSVLFRDGQPADVSTQYRLDPAREDFLGRARARTDVRAQEDLKRLYSFMMRTAGELTVAKLLGSAMDEIFEATGADRGFMLLADEEGSLEPSNVRLREERPEVKAAGDIRVSRTLSRHVMEKGESLMLTEVKDDRRFSDSTAFGTGDVLSVIAAPLKVHDKCSGLVYVDTLKGGRVFSQSDQELVTAMSLVTAAVLENVRLYEQIIGATEFSAAVLRSLSSGLVVVDNSLTVRKVNRAALAMLCAEEIEVVGRGLAELPGIAELAEAISGALARREPVDRRELEIRLGESDMPVGVSVSFMTGPGGETQGAVANFRDLSQINRLREQVKRQEHLAALGEMAAGVAHEIRNPLNSIRGFAQLLTERLGQSPAGGPPAQEAEYLHIIVEEVDRMNGIVQDLLDFARQRQITMARVSVGEVLGSVLAGIRREAAELGMEVVEEIEAGLPEVYGSADKLHQVFANICRNALQAMGGGGRLTVRAWTAAGSGGAPRELAVSFADTGPGIPEAVLPRIFDPFFTTKDVGTGLGLPICAKIVEVHSGRIEVDSPSGAGATFTVALPLPEAGAPGRAAPAP